MIKIFFIIFYITIILLLIGVLFLFNNKISKDEILKQNPFLPHDFVVELINKINCFVLILINVLVMGVCAIIYFVE